MARKPEATPAPVPEAAPAATVAPAQRVPGLVNVWPILDDERAPAAVRAGELDEILVELDAMALRHGSAALQAACDERMRVVGLSRYAPPSPTHPDPRPFRWQRG